MSHTEKPWRVAIGDAKDVINVDDETVAHCCDAEHANRIAACLNACVCMTNPLADIAALKEAVEVQGLQLEMAEAAERVSARRFQKINNLQPQAEALHRIASLFDLPAGTDVVVETLNRVKALKAERESLLEQLKQVEALSEIRLRQRDELLAALEKMNRAYVNLLENGRDRIIMLGGQCDPVDVMESNDPALKESRESIARVKGGAT